MRNLARVNGRIAVTQMQLRKAALGYGAGGGGTTSTRDVNDRIVASWTSSGGRFYYDLTHNLSRPVYLILYDTHTGDEFPGAEKQTIGGDLDTVRIWLDSDPGDSRIRLYSF